MRRERARARAGRILLRVEVLIEWLEWLLDRKLLQEDQLEDPTAFGCAMMEASQSRPASCSREREYGANPRHTFLPLVSARNSHIGEPDRNLDKHDTKQGRPQDK